jgi:hypothetical protein
MSEPRDLNRTRERILAAAQKWLLLIGAALLIATLAGCMVGPDYKPPAMKLPAHWNGSDRHMIGSQSAKTDLAQWWGSFNDPILTAMIGEALSSNLDEKLALARVREERAYLVTSRAGLFPTIDLSGSYTRQRYSANTPFGQFPQIVPFAARIEHRALQAADKSEQDHEDHRHHPEAEYRHQRRGAPFAQTSQVVTDGDHRFSAEVGKPMKLLNSTKLDDQYFATSSTANAQRQHDR